MSLCPCGSTRTLEDCCGPIIAGTQAATPEALMRSRYTAYVLGKLDHIERTHVPELRDEFDRADAERTTAEIEWLGLDVRHAEENGDTGIVEFAIRFRRQGQEYLQRERSQFRREDGCWLYVDGEINPKSPPRQVTKVGRNDPCPCGSGRKYKKCCGA
jgi:SEC-C motif-containing protein